MLGTYLTHGLDPILSWLMFITLALFGAAWGVSRAYGFYASFSLYGWPNGSDMRPFTHAVAMILVAVAISEPLAAGSFVGFVVIYLGVELLGDRFPFIKRFEDYCDRVAADWDKPKEEGRKQPPAWLLLIA